jgi:hypothetical protein
MKLVQSKRSRPDIAAAVRGGDWTLGMNGEGVPCHATLKQALQARACSRKLIGGELAYPNPAFPLGAATAQIDLKDNAPNTSWKPLA